MPQSNQFQIALCCAVILFISLGGELTGRAAPPPSPTPTPPLNTIRIGHCSEPGNLTPEEAAKQLEAWIAAERKKGNVIDARPFAINQTTGQLSFSGTTGRFSVVHMNPFTFDYRITVAQEELVTTALSDFIKLLLPPNLGTALGLQSGRVGLGGEKLGTPGELAQIAGRLDGMKPSFCKSSDDPNNNKAANCVAIGAMYETFAKLHNSALLNDADPPNGASPRVGATEFNTIKSPNLKQKGEEYAKTVSKLRNQQADTLQTCLAATSLYTTLAADVFADDFKKLDEAQKIVEGVTALAKDLEKSAEDFEADTELKEMNPVVRCKGYNCADQFQAYAEKAIEILGVYAREIAALRENTSRRQEMFQRLERMRNEEGHFARTSMIIKKFELSQATVTVNRMEINSTQRGQTQSGDAGGNGGGNGNVRSGNSANRANPQPAESGGAGSDGDAPVNNGGANNNQSGGNEQGRGGGDNNNQAQGGGNNKQSQGAGNNFAPAGQITEVLQIGRPRFTLSGGLVYSPLPRRTFQSVKGFALDAAGNPTGDGSADVVGFGENSPRRLLPMVLLNTRLTNFGSANLFFSWGVSAKHDGNFDIEYLLGPSVSLLDDRAFFTFGAYGGQTQNLVADVAVGDALPDTIGDAKLYRKNRIWKPGFSFSYNFSRTKKANATAGGTTARGATPANDLKSELRIGGIPFNLAVGVAFTSLEQRTYDEIVGFARNRQGELTNGQTLTRIVGLSSSSDHRLTPLALLHTRLTNFGNHDFYFSTGVTGKKTDNNFDIEYLLGGSINLYRRKVFLTVGAFAGKQQLLGGDFFEGAALGKAQNVTIQNRYVWKPAVSFSYDITNIVKRGQ